MATARRNKSGKAVAQADSQKQAQAVAEQLQSADTSKEGRKRAPPLKDLMQSADPVDEEPKTFVRTKAGRKWHHKWADRQPASMLQPKQKPVRNWTGLVLVLCSTVGLLLFAARIYLDRYASPQQQYRLYTAEQLQEFTQAKGNSIMLAILGEVYDVSRSPHYYGMGGGYEFFAGRDASRAFISGKFSEDLTDDVDDFSDDQMAALVHWKEFYLKEYKYAGRVIGAFFGEQGQILPALRAVHAGAARAKQADQERKSKRSDHPNCNKRWSQTKGSEVWCDDDMYPRLLTEEISGNLEKRCACFKDLGWSDLRKLYPDCGPSEHRCHLSPPSALNSPKDEL